MSDSGRARTDVYLLDTSAWLKRAHPSVGDRLALLIESGDLAVCAIIKLEALFGAQGHRRVTRAAELDSLDDVTPPADVFDQALDLQQRLSEVGLEGRKVPDLLIAVTAFAHDYTVLHYDRDFEHIAAALPGFNQEWVVPPASI